VIDIAINGLGRIGRNFLKAYLNDNHKNFNIKIINDIAHPEQIIHLFNVNKAKCSRRIEYNNGNITAKDFKARYSCENLDNVDWNECSIVIEATGKFFSRMDAGIHLKKGTEKVIISSPSDEADITLVTGINENKYNPKKHNLISASSCTAQALLPIVEALKPVGIEKIFFTTIHPYTVNNVLLDNPARNLRESRSNTASIVPAQTRADTGFETIYSEIPAYAYSFKVPTSKVACLDTTIKMENNANIDRINSLLKDYSKNNQNLLKTTIEPLVSSDLENHGSSSIVDLSLTQVMNDVAKIFSWYDNEWAYSLRLYELTKFIAYNS
jgi:glyceraldehyde 3-phosphate dehydrogenase